MQFYKKLVQINEILVQINEILVQINTFITFHAYSFKLILHSIQIQN
jgi:hypothetical protein